MQHPELASLIDHAAVVVGSKSELARRVGVSPQRMNDWRSGLRSCPPEKVALIAAEGNFPADQWLARATVWKHEGSDDGARLSKALKKCLRATGAVLAWGSCAVAVEAIRHSTMYRLVKLRVAFS